MMTGQASLDSAPPGAPVVDYYDHNSLAYGKERFDWYRDIRERHGPVVWSPHYGGFWIVLGRKELVEAAKQWQVFSSSGETEVPASDAPGCPMHKQHNGLFLPPRPQAIPLIEDDPPVWEVRRKALNPIFLPGEVAKWRDRIQELVDACIDERIETGTIDFAADIADIVPVIFTLEFVGVPIDNFRELARAHNMSSHLTVADPEWAQVMRAMEGEAKLVSDEIARRRALPPGERGNGVIAHLVETTDMPDDLVLSLSMLMLGAGIDTTASVTGTSLMMISKDPALRAKLVADPALIRPSFQEFLRLSTPTSGLVRTAMADTELGGQKIRKGERVMLCFSAASRDPNEFVEPDSFRFDRRANRHTGFGSGIHRCIGAHYAELEFEIILSTILRRMPDFQIHAEQTAKYENIGIVDGWIRMPASFTPGRRVTDGSILAVSADPHLINVPERH